MKNKKYGNLETSLYISAVRQGLTLAVPVLLLGSFALMLNSLPWEAYQVWLSQFWGGKLSELFVLIYNITLGSLAFTLILTISFSAGRLSGSENVVFYPVTAFCSYLAFTGGIQGNDVYVFDSGWVFTAMCITLAVCALLRLSERMHSKFRRLHTIGADYIFNQVIRGLLPCVLIMILFAVLGHLLRGLGQSTNIANFGSNLFLWLFEKMGNNIVTVLLYVFFTHLLWFFGIHGTNTLDAVAKLFLERGVEINQQLVLSGQLPTEIYSKTFLDVFVFIGGCGTAICLVLALFLAGKKSNNRRVAQMSCVPVLFNISELAVFGLPVIFNPVMIVPFILTPIVLTVISSTAIALGIVPFVTSSITWTSPILLSGYKATNSIAGSVLQLVNIVVGTCIYIPFVRMSEKRQTEKFREAVSEMELTLTEALEQGREPRFLSHDFPYHYEVKTLVEDLRTASKLGYLDMFYQVQVNRKQEISGAEALLRWNHPVVGFISPPLLVTLASQAGFMNEMGYAIFERCWKDAGLLDAVLEKPMQISVNLCSQQLEDGNLLPFVERLGSLYEFCHTTMVFEVTESALLNTSFAIREKLTKLHEMGIKISIDDFGMGHSSMMYLQDNLFDELKLDGSLVKQLLINERTKDIVSGIIRMSEDLHFEVVAEYVETQESQDILLDLGCHTCQGYLYGRPQPLSDFINTLKG